jgi:ubiquitin-protein ligase E3 B
MAKFLNEFYFALVQVCPIDESSTSTLPPRLRQFQCIRKLLMQLYDLDGRRQYRSPESWILISDASRPFASLPQLITSKFRPSQPSQFVTRIRNDDLIAKRILYLMPHTIPFPTRLDIFRDMAVHQRELTMGRRQALLIKVRRQYLMEDGFGALADQGRSTWLGDIRVSFVNELGGMLTWALIPSDA